MYRFRCSCCLEWRSDAFSTIERAAFQCYVCGTLQCKREGKRDGYQRRNDHTLCKKHCEQGEMHTSAKNRVIWISSKAEELLIETQRSLS